MQMANSLKMVVAARAGLLADGLQEGAICPGCNSSSCISLAAGRKMSLQVREEQAEQLRETAATLKQAFQTVSLCTPQPAAAYTQQCAMLVLYVCPFVASSTVLPMCYLCVIFVSIHMSSMCSCLPIHMELTCPCSIPIVSAIQSRCRLLEGLCLAMPT